MERWLVVVVVVATALRAGAGAARYADYSAARMPQYDAVNYDSRVRNAPQDESYRDRDQPTDLRAPIDNDDDYAGSNNEAIENGAPSSSAGQAGGNRVVWTPPHWKIDRRILKTPYEVESLPEKKSTTVIIDYGDSDYNYKSEKISPGMRVSRKSFNNRNKSKTKQIGVVIPRSKLSQKTIDHQVTALDDEEAEIPSKEYEDEEEELNSDHDRNRFVRRDIRHKDGQKPWPRRTTGASLGGSEYDDQGDGEHIKDTLKTGPEYSDSESTRNRANAPPLLSRPQNYNSVADLEDESPSLATGKYRAPMPKLRKKPTEYVDYNDMNRIEKIKNLSGRRSTVRADASQSQRWSYQDNFHRRNFNVPQQSVEVTTAPSTATSVPSTATSVTTSNKTALTTPIAELSPEIIQNITSFINKSRHLSLAEKSQLSILKKAQRKDIAKDEMLKDKPPVLLQVTEKLQTVVMVEPPVSQEPWLRARDISEDSPERIEKVKRFMRNKLVANARNVSELMEHWDDTVCDYVDITTLDKSTAVSTYTFSSFRFMFHHLLIFLYLSTFLL